MPILQEIELKQLSPTTDRQEHVVGFFRKKVTLEKKRTTFARCAAGREIK